MVVNPNSEFGTLGLNGADYRVGYAPESGSRYRAPKDKINIKILQARISGIPLAMGQRTRMRDPYVYTACWGPTLSHHSLSLQTRVQSSAVLPQGPE